jgi:hypothetical protein
MRRYGIGSSLSVVWAFVCVAALDVVVNVREQIEGAVDARLYVYVFDFVITHGARVDLETAEEDTNAFDLSFAVREF